MRLTSFTDYSLRTLVHLGMNRDRLVTIQEIAEMHSISKNHLMKVVHQLGVAGYLDTVRGRNGGLRLRLEPSQINLGAVVRSTETDFYMAECFDSSSNSCPLSANCRLKHALATATFAYLAVLDAQTLDMLLPEAGAAGERGAKGVKGVKGTYGASGISGAKGAMTPLTFHRTVAAV